MKVLITGGAGFIGSNFVKYIMKKHPDWEIINYDKLTYAGNLKNLTDVASNKNYQFIKGDVRDLNFLCHLLKDVDYVFHLAAESHVDNSIGNSIEFTKSNTLGTHIILEASRLSKVKRILHVSTDEVYGDLLEGSFDENDNLNPTNPYSASKAAAEMIVHGYYRTYKLPILMVRGNNNYGPYQYPEKIIPRFITNIIHGKKVPLHGDGSNIRTFINVQDFCSGIYTVFEKGKIGEIYNVGTEDEISNLELTRLILKKLGKDDSWIEFVTDRPFNDKRYSVKIDKLLTLGWKPEILFEQGLDDTIKWYKENEDWWESLTLD